MGTWEPDWVVAPGEILQEWMDDAGYPHEVLAARCSMDIHTLRAILTGGRISDDLADHLAQGTGIRAVVWRRLEQMYRDGLRAGKEAT